MLTYMRISVSNSGRKFLRRFQQHARRFNRPGTDNHVVCRYSKRFLIGPSHSYPHNAGILQNEPRNCGVVDQPRVGIAGPLPSVALEHLGLPREYAETHQQIRVNHGSGLEPEFPPDASVVAVRGDVKIFLGF